jgi:hypothetical protein
MFNAYTNKMRWLKILLLLLLIQTSVGVVCNVPEKVVDSVTNLQTKNALVALFNPADSSLVGFTRVISKSFILLSTE